MGQRFSAYFVLKLPPQRGEGKKWEGVEISKTKHTEPLTQEITRTLYCKVAASNRPQLLRSISCSRNFLRPILMDTPQSPDRVRREGGARGHFEIGHGDIAGCSIFQFSFWQQEWCRERNFPSRLGHPDKLFHILRSLSQMMQWELSLAIQGNKWGKTDGSLCRQMLCSLRTIS